MQGIFYTLTTVALLGYLYNLLEPRTEKRRYNKYLKNKSNLPIRQWIAVKHIEKPEKKIPVLVKDTGKKELVSALRVIRDEPFADYTKYSYNELLATVTPEEIEQLQSLKEFMK